jgi:gas vesicle protein
MNDRSEYLICTLCFVVGGIAGAGAALLLAPQAGRDTRGRVGRRLRGAAGSARELAERAIRRGEEIGAEAARRVESASSLPAGNGGGQTPSQDAVPST